MHHGTTFGTTASRVWAVRAHLRRLSESGGIRTVPFGPGASLKEARQMVRRWNTVSDECHSIPVGHCTHGAAAGLHCAGGFLKLSDPFCLAVTVNRMLMSMSSTLLF